MQADLYYFLIQECNVKYWENPFECTNVLIKASIGISEPSLIDARNRLKQLGLIDFQNGKRNEVSPVYKLLYLNKFSKDRGEPLVEGSAEPDEKGTPFIKQNKTKQTSIGGEPPSTQTLEEKQKERLKRMAVFRDEVKGFAEMYSNEMLKDFYDYWIEPNKSKTKMKYEMQKTWDLTKRLARWEKNDFGYKKKGNEQPATMGIPDDYAQQRQKKEERTRQLAKEN